MSTPEPTQNEPAGQPQQSPRSEPPKPEPPAKQFTQAELDAIVADRLSRDRATREKRFADYDELKQKAGNYDRLLQDTETETERRVREAREQAQAEALAKVRPELVAARFEAAAARHGIEPDRLDTLLEDLDLTRFLREDGSVDLERVNKKAAVWAPAAPPAAAEQEKPQAPRRPRPDPTQGSGRKPAGDGDRGIAEAMKRFGDRARVPGSK